MRTPGALLLVAAVLASARANADDSWPAAPATTWWIEARPWTCSQWVPPLARLAELSCDATGGCSIAADAASATRRAVLRCEGGAEGDAWTLEARSASGERQWEVDLRGEPEDRLRKAAAWIAGGGYADPPSVPPAVTPPQPQSSSQPPPKPPQPPPSSTIVEPAPRSDHDAAPAPSSPSPSHVRGTGHALTLGYRQAFFIVDNEPVRIPSDEFRTMYGARATLSALDVSMLHLALASDFAVSRGPVRWLSRGGAMLAIGAPYGTREATGHPLDVFDILGVSVEGGIAASSDFATWYAEAGATLAPFPRWKLRPFVKAAYDWYRGGLDMPMRGETIDAGLAWSEW